MKREGYMLHLGKDLRARLQAYVAANPLTDMAKVIRLAITEWLDRNTPPPPAA